jgi:hypothetical protein
VARAFTGNNAVRWTVAAAADPAIAVLRLDGLLRRALAIAAGVGAAVGKLFVRSRLA